MAIQVKRIVNWANTLTVDITYDDVTGIATLMSYVVNPNVKQARLVFSRTAASPLIDRIVAGGESNSVNLPTSTAQRLTVLTPSRPVIERRPGNFGYAIEVAY